MNCERAREWLVLDIYGDLGPLESVELRPHLELCPSCQKDRNALTATRSLLDAATVPEVSVNVLRVVQESAVRQDHLLRRWRRGAIAVGSLAAGLLLFLLIRPEIRLGGGEIVIRWDPAPKQHEQPAAVVHLPPPNRDIEMDERILILSDLIRALRNDMENSDRERKQQLEVLVTRLDLLRLQTQQRWDQTRNDVTALYQAQFGMNSRGDRR
jgi:hypothetical protein